MTSAHGKHKVRSNTRHQLNCAVVPDREEKRIDMLRAVQTALCLPQLLLLLLCTQLASKSTETGSA
jgi:hypothetical protein